MEGEHQKPEEKEDNTPVVDSDLIADEKIVIIVIVVAVGNLAIHNPDIVSRSFASFAQFRIVSRNVAALNTAVILLWKCMGRS